jgi:Fic family protein
MATSNLALRFTEEKYSTKSEVTKELKIHYIDNIWSNILSYRANFNKYLALYTIESKQFIFCNCVTINANIENLSKKFSSIISEIQKMRNVNDKNYIRQNCLASSLSHIAKKNDLDVTKEYLLGIIRGEINSLSSSHSVLSSYLNALKYVENNYYNDIDETYLADLYSKLLNTDELISFYRTAEDKAHDNRVVISRVYTAAPIKLIPNLMTQLYSFIKNKSLPDSVKAMVAYYYINYIKPFASHNDEIAVLIAKAILGSAELGEYTVLLPLERLLSSDLEKITLLSIETQKTGDVTYFANYGIELLNTLCGGLLDKIANLNVESLRNDFYKTDEETFQVVQEQPVIQLAKEEDRVEEEPAKKIVTQEVKQVEQPKVVEEQLAVTYIPKAIDEKEAYRLEKHLLELDPTLKKGEAKFYARHCTLGKKYTIQQYKKYIGCAYETARTSMDHLAELGYYRKEQVKNKYVYAPIPRN